MTEDDVQDLGAGRALDVAHVPGHAHHDQSAVAPAPETAAQGIAGSLRAEKTRGEAKRKRPMIQTLMRRSAKMTMIRQKEEMMWRKILSG